MYDSCRYERAVHGCLIATGYCLSYNMFPLLDEEHRHELVHRSAESTREFICYISFVTPFFVCDFLQSPPLWYHYRSCLNRVDTNTYLRLDCHFLSPMKVNKTGMRGQEATVFVIVNFHSTSYSTLHPVLQNCMWFYTSTVKDCIHVSCRQNL